MNGPQPFSHLQEMAAASRLGRSAQTGAARLGAAWTHSSLARTTSRVGAWAGTQPPEALVRLGGFALFWLGVGRLLFVWTTSPYVATGLPWWVTAIGPGIALGVAFGAGAVTRAASESVVVRALMPPPAKGQAPTRPADNG